MLSLAGHTLLRWASTCRSGLMSYVASAAVVLLDFCIIKEKFTLNFQKYKRRERSEQKNTGIRKHSLLHLYMMRSEEKLTIEIGLFYKIWICDAHLRNNTDEKVLTLKNTIGKQLKSVIHANTTNSNLSRILGQSHSEQWEVFQHLTTYRSAAHLEETKGLIRASTHKTLQNTKSHLYAATLTINTLSLCSSWHNDSPMQARNPS